MNRRAFLLASALALPPLLTLSPRTPFAVAPASATVAALVSLDELVVASTYVVVATPGERYSVWEEMPSGKRIVTYTRLSVERTVVGNAPGGDVWVRTLGGAVDKIGQSVAGEARLTSGSRAMIFLAHVNGVVVVTGMAQGHYPIVADDQGVSRLAASPDTGMLVPRRGPTLSAHEQLVGGTLDQGAALVLSARKARDANR